MKQLRKEKDMLRESQSKSSDLVKVSSLVPFHSEVLTLSLISTFSCYSFFSFLKNNNNIPLKDLKLLQIRRTDPG